MRQPRKKMDGATMVSASFHASDVVRNLRETVHLIDTDPDRTNRLKVCECKYCFYYSNFRVGGATPTTMPCMSCAKDLDSGNTCTDVLCVECATEGHLCKHCGGDLDMRPRRRKWPEPKVPYAAGPRANDYQ